MRTTTRFHANRRFAGTILLLLAVALIAAACGDAPGDAAGDTAGDNASDNDTSDNDTSDNDTSDDAAGIQPADGEDAIVLDVSVRSDEGAGPVSGTLRCGTDRVLTGDLEQVAADAEAACAAVRAVADDGSLGEYAAGGQMCTQQYGGPQEATLTGEIDGAAIDITVDRADGCGIALWEALTPLLGQPVS